jgi:hypothetical protein
MTWYYKYQKYANSKGISLDQVFYKKYLLYKNKYLNLKNKNKQTGGTINCKLCSSDHCMKTRDCIIAEIEQIPDDSIQIHKIIPGDDTKESELIVIPGFSDSSYKRNFSSLFKFYDKKLDTNNFKQTILIKFKDPEEFSIRAFNLTFFDESNTIIDPLLENKLYVKCAEILAKLLKPNVKYTILAKSAGGGVGICLSQIIYEQIHKMFLFAPGAEYLPQSIDKLFLHESKITVGWNTQDEKVRMSKVWPELSKLLPNTKVLTFNKDIYCNTETQKHEDTQHEINSKFIQYIRE